MYIHTWFGFLAMTGQQQPGLLVNFIFFNMTIFHRDNDDEYFTFVHFACLLLLLLFLIIMKYKMHDIEW